MFFAVFCLRNYIIIKKKDTAAVIQAYKQFNRRILLLESLQNSQPFCFCVQILRFSSSDSGGNGASFFSILLWHTRIYAKMDQETVYQLFLASYQPSLEARKQAEFNIKNVHWLN